MAPAAPKERLRDIQAAARDVLAFVHGMSRSDFEALPETDHKTYRAVKNAISEIGEAAKSLPPEICKRHPEVDWRGFGALRNIVIHQYFAFDLSRLWPVLTDEFPALLRAVATELGDDIEEN